MEWLTGWLPRPGEASPLLQLIFLTLFALTILAIVVLTFYVLGIRRVARALQGQVTALEAGRRQNAERLDGLTLATERLATHHHVGAAMGHDYDGDALDDHPVLIEQAVDSSIPWVNPVHLIHDAPDLVRDSDLPLERFADPAPITDPNLRAVATGNGRALPPVPPDPRRLRQFVAPARTITSEPITAVDSSPAAPGATGAPRAPRHAAPSIGRHAAS